MRRNPSATATSSAAAMSGTRSKRGAASGPVPAPPAPAAPAAAWSSRPSGSDAPSTTPARPAARAAAISASITCSFGRRPDEIPRTGPDHRHDRHAAARRFSHQPRRGRQPAHRQRRAQLDPVRAARDRSVQPRDVSTQTSSRSSPGRLPRPSPRPEAPHPARIPPAPAAARSSAAGSAPAPPRPDSAIRPARCDSPPPTGTTSAPDHVHAPSPAARDTRSRHKRHRLARRRIARLPAGDNRLGLGHLARTGPDATAPSPARRRRCRRSPSARSRRERHSRPGSPAHAPIRPA